MHLIPTKTEEWKRLGLSLFRIYIVVAYGIWKICDLYIDGDSSSFDPPFAITAGYILSIFILTFAAGIQFGAKQRKAASENLVYIGIGVVFLLIKISSLSALIWITPAVNILANGLVLYFSLATRRNFKTRTLTFWIWGCSINLLREIGIFFVIYPGFNNADIMPFWRLVHDFPAGSFMEFYWIGYIVAGVLYAAGIILSCRQLQTKEQITPSSNTAMFIALGVLLLIIGMAVSLSWFGQPEFLPTIIINGVVCWFSLVAYQRLKLKTFLCLALASAFIIARTAGLDLYHHWSFPASGFEQSFLEWLSIFGIITSVLWAIGTILVIQSIRNWKSFPQKLEA